MSEQLHEDHTGPIKTPKQMMWVSVFSFVLPVFIIIGLVFFVTSDKKPSAGATNMEKSVSERVQKVGTVEIRDANRALKNGEAVYQAQCVACHGAGVAGAPKLADKAAWSARIKTGLDAMVNSALKGKGAMAPQGGGDHSDVEIARAVVYLANAGGAKFAEPKAPEAAK
jgi:cytochrome c5